MEQIKVEEDLIRQGTHPEFKSLMQSIQDKESNCIQEIKDSFKYQEINIQKMYDSQVQFANQTFLVVLNG